MAKLGGRLSRAGSGSTVRNLKSAAVRINLTCTRVRVSPAQGKRRQPNHRITIHHQRQKDRFCLDWTLCRESGDDSTVSHLTLIVDCSQPAPFAGTASSTHFTASIPYHNRMHITHSHIDIALVSPALPRPLYLLILLVHLIGHPFCSQPPFAFKAFKLDQQATTSQIPCSVTSSPPPDCAKGVVVMTS